MLFTHLSPSERTRIEGGLANGLGVRKIADRLGRSPSTVSREIRRSPICYCPGGHYQAWKAQTAYKRRRKASRRSRRLDANPGLRKQVLGLLLLRLSPQQISGRLRRESPGDLGMQVSHETIYSYIYSQPRGRPFRSPVATPSKGKTLRRPRPRGEDRRGRIPGMRSIHDRPAEIEGRSVPGHWEGDLIKGAGNRSAVGVLLERTSRYVILAKMFGLGAQDANDAFARALLQVPRCMRRTLTYDQGKEMSEHRELSRKLGIDIYFADPGCPWQRGSCENANGLIRHFLPKGMDLGGVSQMQLNRIARLLNLRPRRVLEFQNPLEVYAESERALSGAKESSGVAFET